MVSLDVWLSAGSFHPSVRSSSVSVKRTTGCSPSSMDCLISFSSIGVAICNCSCLACCFSFCIFSHVLSFSSSATCPFSSFWMAMGSMAM